MTNVVETGGTKSPAPGVSLAGLAEELQAVRTSGQWRQLRAIPAHIQWNFSSNDYLGLSTHPRAVAAAQEAAGRYGCGAGASRLVCGHTPLHEALEASLARLTALPQALVFPSGYQGNLATISCLAGPDDIIFSDALNHASLIDGCRLSRARIQVYRHIDMTQLEDLLRQHARTTFRRRFILSDTLFSMDGDLAPVEQLEALARQYGAALIVDEAHALGLFGPQGGGVCQERGIRPDVLLGTLSKSLGSAGGFVAAEAAIVDYLINRARPLIYSTGLSPVCAGAAQEAATLLLESPELGRRVREKALYFGKALTAHGLLAAPSPSQILPILLEENEAALDASIALEAAGLLAVAIRPPTVPPGTARLRLSVTETLDIAHLTAAAGLIAEVVAPSRARSRKDPSPTKSAHKH